MNCTELAATGLGVSALVLAGVLTLGLGLLLIVLMRAKRGARVALTLALVLAVGLAVAPVGQPAAQAAPMGCSADAPDSLTLAQTSVMDGLAPNVRPAAITGRVTNVSTDDTYIGDVVVSIHTVTVAAEALDGTCDATDYVLVEPVMEVNEPLAGGASTTFAGASIGFADKSTNQDACQGATVELLYTTG